MAQLSADCFAHGGSLMSLEDALTLIDRRMQTVAVGSTLVPAVVCRLTRAQCAGTSWMCFSIRTIRSSS